MILETPGEVRRQLPGQCPGPVVGGGPAVGHEDVDIGLDPFPERDALDPGGGAELHAMVLDDEVRAAGPAGLDGPAEDVLFLRPELAGHGVELEGDEIMVPAKRDEHVEARLLLVRRIAEAVGAHPDAQPAAETGRLLDEGIEAAGELRLELLGIQCPVVVRDEASDAGRVGPVIDVSHVEGIDVEGQAILVVEPLEEGHIDERLRLGRPFILAVDPIEIMGP